MKIVRITNKFFLYIFYLIKYKSHLVAYNFAHYNFPLHHSKNILSNGHYLIAVSTNNKIHKKSVNRFRQEYKKLAECLENRNLHFSNQSPDGFSVNVNQDVLLNIHSVSNLITLYEIYIETLYKVQPRQSSMIIIDIGMNVGFASLFFAQQEYIEKIYSFEPFPDTFQEASKNFNQNPHLTNKIEPKNYGISNKTGTVSVPMMESGDAGASVNEEILQINGTQNNPSISVNIRDVSEVIEEIKNLHPAHKFILKIDCEGEEYNIFDKLRASNIRMDHVEILIIEWHRKGPDKIVDILTQWQYQILSLPKPDYSSGMLYAFK